MPESPYQRPTHLAAHTGILPLPIADRPEPRFRCWNTSKEAARTRLGLAGPGWTTLEPPKTTRIGGSSLHLSTGITGGNCHRAADPDAGRACRSWGRRRYRRKRPANVGSRGWGSHRRGSRGWDSRDWGILHRDWGRLADPANGPDPAVDSPSGPADGRPADGPAGTPRDPEPASNSAGDRAHGCDHAGVAQPGHLAAKPASPATVPTSRLQANNA